jgi:hypothetical protein
MQQFIAKFKDQITGVISGFDRLIFRGVLRRLVYSQGMEQYLWQNQILFKEYGCHVKKVMERGVKEGLVCALTSLEPSPTFGIGGPRWRRKPMNDIWMRSALWMTVSV